MAPRNGSANRALVAIPIVAATLALGACAATPTGSVLTVRELNAHREQYHLKTVTVRAFFEWRPPHHRALFQDAPDRAAERAREQEDTRRGVEHPWVPNADCLNVETTDLLYRLGKKNRWVTVTGTYFADFDLDGDNLWAGMYGCSQVPGMLIDKVW